MVWRDSRKNHAIFFKFILIVNINFISVSMSLFNFQEKFENKGMIFSGLSPDSKLPETIELRDHPWFIGVQFHPEFKSRPLAPHPLFSSFIKATKINSKK